MRLLQLFYHMEDTGFLDPLNPQDLFCLHFVYKPYINHAIKTFVDAWCSHPMRSVGGITPTQLWIQGMLSSAHSGNIVTEELYESHGPDYVSQLLPVASYIIVINLLHRKNMESIGMDWFLKNPMKKLLLYLKFPFLLVKEI